MLSRNQQHLLHNTGQRRIQNYVKHLRWTVSRKYVRPLLLNSSFNLTTMFKMLMRDVGIIHYTLFYKKICFSCAFFGENWSNAGNITFVFSHRKTLFTLVIGSLRLIRIKRPREVFRRWHNVVLAIMKEFLVWQTASSFRDSFEGEHLWTRLLGHFCLWQGICRSRQVGDF